MAPDATGTSADVCWFRRICANRNCGKAWRNVASRLGRGSVISGVVVFAAGCVAGVAAEEAVAAAALRDRV